MIRTWYLSAVATLLWIAPQGGAQAPRAQRRFHPSDAFNNYWHAGKAEISRFKLSQSRYGEDRDGDAILIFVTEDFLADRQVKHETGDADEAGAVPVLKLNAIRRFTTGLYDYSMMLSVFTPECLDANPSTLKATASVQEWCGQVWKQVNLRANGWECTGHSYRQEEADEKRMIGAALLEDEIWTRIRIDPAKLPTGQITAVPSLFDSRLRHYALKVEKAQATLAKQAGSDSRRSVYSLSFPRLGRTLRIFFEPEFPHRIEAFEEEILEPTSQRSITKAKRTHTMVVDYWTMQNREYASERAELGLK